MTGAGFALRSPRGPPKWPPLPLNDEPLKVLPGESSRSSCPPGRARPLPGRGAWGLGAELIPTSLPCPPGAVAL